MAGKAVENFLVDYGKTIAEFDARLEEAAVKAFGAVDPSYKDGFQPPVKPVEVECWHCDDRYSSSEMRLLYRPRMQQAMIDSLGNGFSALSPMWWCKNAECDGGGYGHDIHRVRASKRKAGA